MQHILFKATEINCHIKVALWSVMPLLCLNENSVSYKLFYQWIHPKMQYDKTSLYEKAAEALRRGSVGFQTPVWDKINATYIFQWKK